MILQYGENQAIEYMDYLYFNDIMNGVKIGVDIIKPRKSKEKEFVDKFADFGFSQRTKPKEIFALLFNNKYSSEFQGLNNRLVNYMKQIFKEPISYGYPVEIKDSDIEFTGGSNEQKILAELVDGANPRVEILDPEIYGGSYTSPKIFIKPPDETSGSGYYLYSKKMFSSLSENKLDNTILKLSKVAKYISDSQRTIDQKRFNKAKFVEDKGDILEKPYSIMVPKQKLANTWGFFKCLIRVYLAELFTLAYPVVKKFGIKHHNYGDLLFSYIEHRMERDVHEIKNLGDPKSTLTPYIIYILMLENIVIEHITTSSDEIQEYFEDRKEQYTSLYEADLEFIKSQTHNSIVLSTVPKYQNFVRGFSVFSFGSNWKNVMNSTVGFSINAFNLDDEDIRLASKIGFIIDDIDMIREIIKEKIIKEAAEYEEFFPPETEDIYTDFMRSEHGLGLDIDNIGFEASTSGYHVKKYIKVTEKNGNTFQTDYEGLLLYMQQYSQDSSISDVLGNAEVVNIYERIYSGTIGVMFGVSLNYKDEVICSYEKDIEDVRIIEIQGLGENLNQDVQCFFEKMIESAEGELFFKHCLKVEKVASLSAIFFMKNLIPSLGKDGDERNLSFNPFSLLDEAAELVSGNVSPPGIYTTTKKEILKNISSFMYNEETDPKESDIDFSDFKKAQTINQNFDFTNLKIKGAESVPYLKRSLITTYIETDKNGNPLVNKFLSSHFSEE